MRDEDAARPGQSAEIQVGEVTIAAIDLAAGHETIDVADFLAEARKVINDGGIVLLRKQLKDYGCPQITSRPQDDLYSLVESVDNCAAVPVSRLASHDLDTSNNLFDYFPCLLGQKAAIRYLSSYSDAALAPEAITESRPHKLYYDEYSQLWADDPDIEYGLRAALSELVTTGHLPGAHLPPVVHESLQDGRRAWAFALGELMAKVHRDKYRHYDAHEGNFGYAGIEQVARFGGEPGMKIIDPNGPYPLYCQPSPAQCATDLAPLLAGFDPGRWRAFRTAYALNWPPGFYALEFIEFADRTGWKAAILAENFPDALKRLEAALATVPSADLMLRIVLLADRAEVLSQLGRHDEALPAADEAERLTATECPHYLPRVQLHLANLRFRSGNVPLGIQTLRDVVGTPQAGTSATINWAREVIAMIQGHDDPSRALPEGAVEHLSFLLLRAGVIFAVVWRPS